MTPPQKVAQPVWRMSLHRHGQGFVSAQTCEQHVPIKWVIQPKTVTSGTLFSKLLVKLVKHDFSKKEAVIQ